MSYIEKAKAVFLHKRISKFKMNNFRIGDNIYEQTTVGI